MTGDGERAAVSQMVAIGEVSGERRATGDGRRAMGVGTKGRARGWPCTPLGLNDGKWQCLDLLRNPQARQLASSPHCSALDEYGTVPQESGRPRIMLPDSC
jgi:hypothetical protein